MRTAFVACLLFACLVAAQDTANPITRTQFQANYQETITISTGGFTTDASIGSALSGLSSSSGIVAKEVSKRGLAAVGDITYTDSGMIYYDSVGRRVRNDVTSISFDFGTGPITSDISATSLILYDLGKNFTWSGSSCDCEGIDNPDIPVLYITPEVTTTTPTSASITVNGQTYTTDHYSSSVFLGGTSTTIDFYVSGQNLLRSVFSGDYLGVTVNYQFDFWNVANLTVTDTLFTPISSCKCPAAAAPVINTTVSFPTSCGTVFDGCSCPTSDLPAGLFCESYLTYQIAANTFVYSTDYFVQTTFQATISLMSSPSTTCQNDLKSFLCHFYFPQCGADGASLKPADPDFSGSDSCGSSNGNVAQQSDAYSTYATAADTQAGSSSSSSSASQVLASLLSLFFIFAALF